MVCERFTQTLFIILGYFASRAVRSLKCFTCSLHKVTTTLLNFLHQHSTLCPVWIQQWAKCQTIHKLGVALLGVRIPPVTSAWLLQGTRGIECPTSASDRSVFERDRYDTVDPGVYFCSVRIAGDGTIYHQVRSHRTLSIVFIATLQSEIMNGAKERCQDVTRHVS